MATESLGIVRGIVVHHGGRDPRSGGGGSAPPRPVGADPITAQATPDGPTFHTVSANDGSFEFQLPPGTYVIQEAISGSSDEVHVAAHLTSTITLTVPGA